MNTTKVQKTILGRRIKSFEFSKKYYWDLKKNFTKGFIWLEGKTLIVIEKGKFLILNSEGKKNGFIIKGSKEYKRIKRMIANWFRPYKNHRIFKYGDGYLTRKFPNKKFYQPSKISIYEHTA